MNITIKVNKIIEKLTVQCYNNDIPKIFYFCNIKFLQQGGLKMYCVNCSDYDAEHKGGWCDRRGERKDPYDSCDLEDDRARSYTNHTCSECSN